MDDLLKIVSALKPFTWLTSYQRKQVAGAVVSVVKSAQREDKSIDDAARVFATALEVLKPENEKAAGGR